MEKLIYLRELKVEYTVSIGNKALVACVDKSDILSFFDDWDCINVGLELSSALQNALKKEQALLVVELLRNMINDTQSHQLILDNIDILFFPEFQLDVLRLLTQLSRNKKLIVIWPGIFRENTLIYSEPGYPDYHVYPVQHYDILCITG